MEVDLTVQSKATAEYNMNAIKEFSPFNEYVIGQKLGLFGEDGTGTQVYIWNLDKWGQDYTLDWNSGKPDENPIDRGRGDILIRSKRVRSRPGQTSTKVNLITSHHHFIFYFFFLSEEGTFFTFIIATGKIKNLCMRVYTLQALVDQLVIIASRVDLLELDGPRYSLHMYSTLDAMHGFVIWNLAFLVLCFWFCPWSFALLYVNI
jgi:hypothetical protein